MSGVFAIIVCLEFCDQRMSGVFAINVCLEYLLQQSAVYVRLCVDDVIFAMQVSTWSDLLKCVLHFKTQAYVQRSTCTKKSTKRR